MHIENGFSIIDKFTIKSRKWLKKDWITLSLFIQDISQLNNFRAAPYRYNITGHLSTFNIIRNLYCKLNFNRKKIKLIAVVKLCNI